MSKTREKIRTLIVDDEPLARRNLRALLKTDPEIEIIGEARSGPEAVRMIKAQTPALVFLDIQMPEMNGFEVLGQIAADDLPAIVFVTAFDKYALKAFEVHALDYHCRTIVLNKGAFCLAPRLKELRDAGARHLRAEFIYRRYTPHEALRAWRQVRAGRNVQHGHAANFDRGML